MQSAGAAPTSNSVERHVTALSDLYTTDEKALVSTLASATGLDMTQRTRIEGRAAAWVETVRANTKRIGMIDAFLQEYGLSTNEGIILMRLSEALIRTPDFATAQELMRDKLIAGDWDEHAGLSPTIIVNAATAGLRLSSAWISATGGNSAVQLAAKLGDRVLHGAVVRGMGIMARHFVLGRSISDAVMRAKRHDKSGALYSFDMLGEGALTLEDAQIYMKAYEGAVNHLAGTVGKGASVATAHGLSVKLSALYPRYEYAKRSQCVPFLVEKVKALAVIAKRAGIGLTIDAEEADRLEVSLQIFQILLNDPDLGDWDGLGIVIQAYQRRASATIDFVVDAAAATKRSIAVRLVKGAYWDGEVKRAQEMGLESYPVFTRKDHTDVSYLACAAKLLKAGTHIFPQFATHNAHTASAIIEMAGDNNRFEFQRLHGMGEALHDEICSTLVYTSRVYAPVGGHKELLPYLVRRLLENGANSSFVNQLMNPDIEVDDIVADPLTTAAEHDFSPNPAIPNPRDMFSGKRQSARGMDLTQADIAAKAQALLPLAKPYKTGGQGAKLNIHNPANLAQIVGHTNLSSPGDVEEAVARAHASKWFANSSPQTRAACLNNAADAMEVRMGELMGLCVAEAGKTLPDAVAEVREAVDFCRYYADQAMALGDANREPLGVVACISPWNFPLAIFIGQVAAALVMGNAVVAKPAGQTPLIAHVGASILYEAGVPKDVLHLVIGEGDIGAALVGNPLVDGVCFTGSTQTAQRIAKARADIGRTDSVLIAETGGINAMIVDSTALLEQAVSDVVASAFQSAGQRCSACRLVCVQEDIAQAFEHMLTGAIEMLALGDPADLATDVGPIIDAPARQKIEGYIAAARTTHRIIGEAKLPQLTSQGHFIAPVAIGVDAIKDVSAEIFGPVLHVARFAAKDTMNVVDQINELGFGLTLGVHSRIDARIRAIAGKAKVGNIYVNRNQIGAVVGVQPFGGEGLSGTGPKAGGPHYLRRLSRAAGSAKAATSSLNPSAALSFSPPDPAFEAAFDAKIKAARGAQKVWANYNRVALSNQVAGVLGDRDFVENGFAQTFQDLMVKTSLPGPTGEDNSLTLSPRGVLLCLGGDGPDDIVRQILLTLASGSAVLVPAFPDGLRIQSLVSTMYGNAKLPSDLIATIETIDLGGAVHGPIDGVIADGCVRAPTATHLALRTGSIIPLLASGDEPWRYFHERTLTIDTTAAGGNASLLAMQATASEKF